MLLRNDAVPTQAGYWATAGESVPAEERDAPPPGTIDPYVRQIMRGTCGNMYASIRDLPRYPIPELPLPRSDGGTFLDLGSNWGRWCVAAARQGYRALGIDPSLGAIRAARRVATQLGADVSFVVADARHLPFPDASFDVVFSYSVLQHFSKEDARAALAEAARVLRPGGTALVQLANGFGVRSLYNRLRTGFREPKAFDVRYWTPGELIRVFTELIGPAQLEADGFFSLNAQRADLPLLPWRARGVVLASHALTRAAAHVKPLVYVADSLYVRARRP